MWLGLRLAELLWWCPGCYGIVSSDGPRGWRCGGRSSLGLWGRAMEVAGLRVSASPLLLPAGRLLPAMGVPALGPAACFLGLVCPVRRLRGCLFVVPALRALGCGGCVFSGA